MSGHHEWSAIRREGGYDPTEEAYIEEGRRAYRVVNAIAALRDLEDDAKWYGRHHMQPVAEPRVSEIERAEDEYLDTLAWFVADMGGRLEVVAVFPDERILLTRPEPEIDTTDAP